VNRQLAILFVAASAAVWGQGFPERPADDPQATKLVLTRRVPSAVRLQAGSAHIEVTGAAQVQREVLDTLNHRLRAEFSKEVRMVDSSPDYLIRVRVEWLEEVSQDQQKTNGDLLETWRTYKDSISATYEIVETKSGKAIDSGHVKEAAESPFVIARARQQVRCSDKASRIAGVFGGRGREILGRIPSDDACQAAAVASRHNAGAVLPPTPAERYGRLMDSLSAALAKSAVTSQENVVVPLPGGQLSAASQVAVARQWGRLEEDLSKQTLKGKSDDAYRLYLLGVGYEALAYEHHDPAMAQELLVKAVDSYAQAQAAHPGEKEFRKAELRAQESCYRYVSKGTVKETVASGYNNDYLIGLHRGGRSDEFILSEIRDAVNAQFDDSPQGKMQLLREGLSERVVMAVKQRMMNQRPAAQ
jgi:hypothetical protein